MVRALFQASLVNYTVTKGDSINCLAISHYEKIRRKSNGLFGGAGSILNVTTVRKIFEDLSS